MIHGVRRLGLAIALIFALGCGKAPEPPGSISGSMWAEDVPNQVVPFRGVMVYLLPISVPKGSLKVFSEGLGSRPLPLQKSIKPDFQALGQDDPVKLHSLWWALYHAKPDFGGGTDSDKYRYLIDQPNWALALRDAAIEKTSSGIDGKYRFEEIPPGEYLVFSDFKATDYYISWLEYVTVLPGKNAAQDFCDTNYAINQNADQQDEK